MDTYNIVAVGGMVALICYALIKYFGNEGSELEELYTEILNEEKYKVKGQFER